MDLVALARVHYESQVASDDSPDMRSVTVLPALWFPTGEDHPKAGLHPGEGFCCGLRVLLRQPRQGDQDGGRLRSMDQSDAVLL